MAAGKLQIHRNVFMGNFRALIGKKKAEPQSPFQVLYQKYRDYTMIPEKVFCSNLELAQRIVSSDVSGAVVECGVWKGGMSAALAELLGSRRTYHLLDSFEGLPPVTEADGPWAKQWQERKDLWYFDNCKAEQMYAREAMRLSGVEHFQIHQGWFKDSLPVLPDFPIALLRLDGDWYDSTYTCLEHLYPRVISGGLVILDDYYAWEGCIRACYDYFSAHKVTDRIRCTSEGVAYLIKNEPFPFQEAIG